MLKQINEITKILIYFDKYISTSILSNQDLEEIKNTNKNLLSIQSNIRNIVDQINLINPTDVQKVVPLLQQLNQNFTQSIDIIYALDEQLKKFICIEKNQWPNAFG